MFFCINYGQSVKVTTLSGVQAISFIIGEPSIVLYMYAFISIVPLQLLTSVLMAPTTVNISAWILDPPLSARAEMATP